MHAPYVPAANGEWMGLAWFIRTVPGRDGKDVRVIRHGGGTKGQISTIQFAPAHRFAMVILTNSGRGDELTRTAVTWALDHYLHRTRSNRGAAHDGRELAHLRRALQRAG